jgi:NADH dehydrogenase
MRILVLGAGYAGLALARRLTRQLPNADDVVVVDERETHLLQTLLHRVIRRPDLADAIRIPITDLLEGVDVRHASVAAVSPTEGTAVLAPVDGDGDRETVDYDLGAVCLGVRTDYQGLTGVRNHAQPCKRVAHARAIRERFLDVVDDSGGPARVVVGGAGLSGIQVAGELAALAHERGVADRLDLHLIEQADEVAPAFPPRFREAVAAELSDRDLTVRTGASVAGADGDAIALGDGTRIPYDQLVWTGGIRGRAAMDGDRPTVRPTLRAAPDTFLLGDAARVVDRDGEPVPASAQAAAQQAAVAASNLATLANYRRGGETGFEPRLERLTFDPRGWVVSVGDGAVALVGGRVVRGRPAHLLKTGIGVGYLGGIGAVSDALGLVRQELGLPAPRAEEPETA